jgi:hypothetical protein
MTQGSLLSNARWPSGGSPGGATEEERRLASRGYDGYGLQKRRPVDDNLDGCLYALSRSPLGSGQVAAIRVVVPRKTGMCQRVALGLDRGRAKPDGEITLRQATRGDRFGRRGGLVDRRRRDRDTPSWSNVSPRGARGPRSRGPSPFVAAHGTPCPCACARYCRRSPHAPRPLIPSARATASSSSA